MDLEENSFYPAGQIKQSYLLLVDIPGTVNSVVGHDAGHSHDHHHEHTEGHEHHHHAEGHGHHHRDHEGHDHDHLSPDQHQPSPAEFLQPQDDPNVEHASVQQQHYDHAHQHLLGGEEQFLHGVDVTQPPLAEVVPPEAAEEYAATTTPSPPVFESPVDVQDGAEAANETVEDLGESSEPLLPSPLSPGSKIVTKSDEKSRGS
jgi:hypothetical protein